jgi:acyl-[acyl-carrier-protein]-phospholipid O-acyltransferase/long-chain-fatty-acid--[acyl-carrier-protein] ligase
MPLDAGPDVTLIHLEDAAAAISKFERLRAILMVLLLPGWLLDRWGLRMGRHSLDDIATIIFSSGSTGDPKGVMLSHRNIACNAESMVALVDVDHHDRLLSVLPLFHSFGYTVTMWMPLLIGGSAVFHADPRQAKEIGELCKTFRCSILLSTATFLRFYLRRCEADDFKSLRYLVCGAEKLPPALAKEFESKFGVLPTEGYGITELSPVIAAGIPDRAIGGMKQLTNKFGSVGPPVAGVAVRIVDPDTLQPLPQGTDGIIMVKGGNVMAGYLNQPDLTKKAIVDGWYNTGDMGRLDEDGFLVITGRLSRFAKIGGEMAPLEKIEEEMHAALGTNDRVLAVAAVPDEKRGERLVVVYLPTMSLPVAELTGKLAARGMQNLWIPSDRDFYQVDEIPALGTGKLDLRGVKELALKVARRG